MQREEFLARVRQATAAGRAYQVAINPAATAEKSYVGGGDDPVGTFLLEWRAVGGFGDRLPDRAAILDYLSHFLQQHTVRSVLLWRDPVLEELQLTGWLQQQGLQVHLWDELEQIPRADAHRTAFTADLGITGVDRAIAETGSLAVYSRAGGRGRAVSLLPPFHVAIFTPQQLLPDLFDLFRDLQVDVAGSALPSNVTLITGPSKTGDIQLKLTTGVHGPGEVHAIVWER